MPDNISPISEEYKASITREQFMFHEMRTTAKLLMEGLSDDEVVQRIVAERLFQAPTERLVRGQALACLRRLHGLNDDDMVCAIATQPSDVSRQICLYAFMKYNRLVWDFMITVIGEKYRNLDLSFGKMDVNAFFLRLQGQIDSVAAWSDSTVAKAKQVLVHTLVENEYLDGLRADHLNLVWLNSRLEKSIRDHRDDSALAAFNRFD